MSVIETLGTMNESNLEGIAMLTLIDLFHMLQVGVILSLALYLVADFLADRDLGEISEFAAFIRDRW